MRWSQMFIPTLREDPAYAEAASHRLLTRAGYIKQLTSGVYSLLPLAQRVRFKVINIIREEMKKIGAQEFLLPALQPSALWEETGRWQTLSDIMFRLYDRKNTQMALGPTHEEVFTSIARNCLTSYRQLPQLWYQIQTKFRDEARPKGGLLRVREFTMKDAYSFDVDFEGLERSFQDQYSAYCKIFTRCGLKFIAVEASSGAMGGSQSIEFMSATDSGEDQIALCNKCDYAANIEKARTKFSFEDDKEEASALEEFATPSVRTIEDLVKAPYDIPAHRQIKTLVFVSNAASKDPQLILVLIPGDYELNEAKLVETIKSSHLRQAEAQEIRQTLGAAPGSLGAIGITRQSHAIQTIIADEALRGKRNLITGANRDGFHVRGVEIGRDIEVDYYADLLKIRQGNSCPRLDCLGVLEIIRALEIGHIFKLGTKYSESMGASVLDAYGKAVPIVMGSYGIGVERVMAAAAEQYYDTAGLTWPVGIAPFHVVITTVNSEDKYMVDIANDIYKEFLQAGVEVLLDDRDERAGVKFNDADLIGIPYRITVGKKAYEGKVDLTTRATRQAEEMIPKLALDKILVAITR